jgi:hypothetical protein
VNYTGSTSGCDSTLGIAWYQFTGAGGTILADYPPPYGSCGTGYTGWYNGSYPTIANAIGPGTICFNGPNSTCAYTANTLITNCNGFYTFLLFPTTSCNLRYCTM